MNISSILEGNLKLSLQKKLFQPLFDNLQVFLYDNIHSYNKINLYMEYFIFIDLNSSPFSVWFGFFFFGFKILDSSVWKLKEKIFTFHLNENIQFWLMHLLRDSWTASYNHWVSKYCIKIMAESFYQFFYVIPWHWNYLSCKFQKHDTTLKKQ